MGQSKSIEELAKQNEEFEKFIREMRSDLDKELDKQKSVVRGLVEDYHRNYDDEVMVLDGLFSHQTVQSEWSLESVSRMIEACRAAILGGPAPDGVTKGDEADAKKAATALAGIQSVNDIIANAAFNVIQSLLRSVASSTKVEIQSSAKSVPIAPGLQLVIAVVENSYEHKNFFQKESISQTVFVFSARFSVKAGESQAKMAGLNALSDLHAAFASQLRQVSTEIANLDILSATYDERMTRLETIQDRIQARMANLEKEIAKLGGAPENHALLLELVNGTLANAARLRQSRRLLTEA